MVRIISMCSLVLTFSCPASADVCDVPDDVQQPHEELETASCPSPNPAPVWSWSAIPNPKIYTTGDGCVEAGKFDDVSLGMCKQKCEESHGCNTINHPLGQCVLRACRSPVPDPESKSSEGFIGYKYLGNSKWSPHYTNIWNHEQCPLVTKDGVINDVTIEECQSRCEDTNENYHCTAVNFQAYGDCVLHACGSPIPSPSESYHPKHGRKWGGWAYDSYPSFATGRWINAGSAGAGTISTSLTIGLSWSDSSTVTKEDQIALSNALETDAWFMKDTITTTYTHSYSQAVMQSNLTTRTWGCEVTCGDLPSGYYTWIIYQWELSAKKEENKYIGLKTCHFQCIPETWQGGQGPMCPQCCCEGEYCSHCRPGCLNNCSNAVLI